MIQGRTDLVNDEVPDPLVRDGGSTVNARKGILIRVSIVISRDCRTKAIEQGENGAPNFASDDLTAGLEQVLAETEQRRDFRTFVVDHRSPQMQFHKDVMILKIATINQSADPWEEGAKRFGEDSTLIARRVSERAG